MRPLFSRRTIIRTSLSLLGLATLPMRLLAAEKARDKSKPKPAAGNKADRLAPLSITALTEVFGEGQKLTAVTLEYPEAIDTASLDANSFGVRTRRIKRIYANKSGLPTEAGENGRFVVIELSPKDATAALFSRLRGEVVRNRASATVMQKGNLVTVSGRRLPPSTEALDNTAVRNPVVEDFKPQSFSDPASGETLAYHLFTPRDYDPKKSYPLVLFLHDEGVSGQAGDAVLVQGLGAVVWARPEEQEKRPCFVLAPQYSGPVVDDRQQPTPARDATVALVKDLAGRYAIDRKRLYATGQSSGATMAVAMTLKYPDLFAASFLVAGQPDPPLAAPLAQQKLWLLASEGDVGAYASQNAMLSVMEQAGARISRAVWDGRATPDKAAEAVTLMESAKTPINAVVLKKGTVVPPGFANDADANHVNTWRIAYDIEGIRAWLFQQKKS